MGKNGHKKRTNRNLNPGKLNQKGKKKSKAQESHQEELVDEGGQAARPELGVGGGSVLHVLVAVLQDLGKDPAGDIGDENDTLKHPSSIVGYRLSLDRHRLLHLKVLRLRVLTSFFSTAVVTDAMIDGSINSYKP